MNFTTNTLTYELIYPKVALVKGQIEVYGHLYNVNVRCTLEEDFLYRKGRWRFILRHNMTMETFDSEVNISVAENIISEEITKQLSYIDTPDIAKAEINHRKEVEQELSQRLHDIERDVQLLRENLDRVKTEPYENLEGIVDNFYEILVNKIRN